MREQYFSVREPSLAVGSYTATHMDWVILIVMCATSVSPHLYNYQVGMRENFIIHATSSSTYQIEKDIRQEGRFIMARVSNIFSSDGLVQENIAGSLTGVTGYQEGVGEAARLSSITGFVQLNRSSIVVIDHMNHCLRHIDRETKQTTPFAGTCQTAGYRDGPSGVLFNSPIGILLSGNVMFIADRLNHAMRTVDKHSRTVQTLARDETALYQISYLLVESPVSLLASTWGSGVARINRLSGQVTTLTERMPGGFDSVLHHATFYRPSGLAWLDRDLLLIADYANSRLRLMDFETATTSTVCASARLHEASADCFFHGIWSLLYTDGVLLVGLAGREQKLRILRVDLDECQLGMHSCPAHSMCSNTDGSYTCACAPGYTSNASMCEDVDECQLSMDTCHSNATCINIDSSFVCLCSAGFTGDGVSCEDINECSGEASPCEENCECVNNVGAFYCRCHSSILPTPTQFTDLDECHMGISGCHTNAKCVNMESTFACLCLAGFTGDGAVCQDIDECAAEVTPCEPTAECINTDGAFGCAYPSRNLPAVETSTNITAYWGLHEDSNSSCVNHSSIAIVAGVVCFVLLAVIFGLTVKLIQLRMACRFAASYTLPYGRSVYYSVKSEDPLHADSECGV